MPDSGDAATATKVIFGKYEMGRLLGCGSTAKVYHARDLISGHSVAIKCIRKSTTAMSSAASAAIIGEVSIMRRLRHPHVIRLLEVLASRTKIFLVVELAKGGELFSRLASRGGRALPEDLARRYFHQLISAVCYCHSRGVFHRDLKPENLLLDDAGNLKVSDFGLSAHLPSSSSSSTLLHTLCGTPAYVAPEILAKKGYSGAAVDVWSCGVVLFVLAAGYLPFNDTNLMAMYRKIYKGKYKCPRWTSPELRRLLSRLLHVDPQSRITVDEILHDPWFRTGLRPENWAAMMRCEDDAGKPADEEGRELNAFDIISYSTGLDLSGFFETAATERERWVVAGTAEGVVARVEEVAEGVVLRRLGKEGVGGVVMEETRTGSVVARVEVRLLAEGLLMVEVEEGCGEREVHRGGGKWGKKLRSALKGTSANAGGG